VTTIDAQEIPLNLPRTLTSAEARYYGVYPATVADNQDPDNQGRVLVHLPWSPDPGGDRYEIWARLSTLMAGGDRGTWFIPDKEDEVLVSFLAGDPRHPYVIGALWNGQDAPPETIDSDNNVKAIVSRTGITIKMDDTQSAVTLTIETPGGQSIILSDSGTSVLIEDSNGNSCQMDASGVTLTAATKLTINAPTAEINIGQVTANSAMWTHSGVIQCDTHIATTVIGATYTPGVGNIW
jgi:uncharacterized protein involved in type VI secretion and phage assembly